MRQIQRRHHKIPSLVLFLEGHLTVIKWCVLRGHVPKRHESSFCLIANAPGGYCFQDYALPYMSDDRHAADTLFIVAEEDWRCYIERAEVAVDGERENVLPTKAHPPPAKTGEPVAPVQ